MLLNQIIISFCEYSSVGETVHVICEAESVPAAKTFSWTFNGTPLSRGGAADPVTHSIIETQHGTLVRDCSITTFYVNMTNQDEEHRFSDYLEATQGSIIVEEGDCVATFRVNNTPNKQVIV